jgi:hypothetical protein
MTATPHQRLGRARAALDRALAAKADPWRVAELRLAYDAALAEALDGPGPGPARGEGWPEPYGPADAVPLSWVDESGPAPGRGRRS